MKVVVTGGAGFIGSHVVRDLLERDVEVHVVDNLYSGYRHNLPNAGESFHELDIRSADLAPVMKNANAVVHLAALVSVPLSIENPEENESINVDGAQRVLDAAAEAGVKRVVLASSAAVYGDAPGLPKREGDAPAPQSPYADAKLGNESQAATLFQNHGVETVALRFFNVFGERQDPSSMYSGVISVFSDRLKAGKGITVYGDGQQTRDFVHAADVAQAIWRCLTTEEGKMEQSRVFNVGTGRQTSLLELIDTLAELLDTPIKPDFGPARAGDVKYSVADISALQQWTGYEPTVSLREGLRRLLDLA